MARLFSPLLLLGLLSCTASIPSFEGGLDGECSDGQDNDGDGFTDCDDADCEQHLDCTNGGTGTGTGTTTTTTTGPDTDGYLCDSERLAGVSSSGSFLIQGSAYSVYPLCSGEFYIGINKNIERLDTNGNLTDIFPMEDGVGSIAVDTSSGLLWVAHQETGAMTAFSLERKQYSPVAMSVSGEVTDIVVGSSDELFVTTEEKATKKSVSGTHIELFNGKTGNTIGTWDLGAYGKRAVFDPATSTVVVGGGGLAAFSYDPKTSEMVLLGEREDACDGSKSAMSLSNDGQHLVYPCSSGNGTGAGMLDFNGVDISSSDGSYVLDGNASPKGAVFSPDSTMLLVTDGASLSIFSTATHEIVERHTPDLGDCLSPILEDMEWSPLGEVVYAVWSCSTEDYASSVSWWVHEASDSTTSTTTETAVDTGDTSITDTGPDEYLSDVTGVMVLGSAFNYQFRVTVSTEEKDCGSYVDWWEVVSLEEELLFRHTFDSPNVGVTSQDSTDGPVNIFGSDEVIVRAHTSTGGYGGVVMRGSKNSGFAVDETVDDSFAAKLEKAEPQPPDCVE